ncbi:hypothetical protein BGX30_009925 [Mortierella sp. GBA39]|nr:hypothetical protein BGX30_009925 [Mortierella sp. GBA39]
MKISSLIAATVAIVGATFTAPVQAGCHSTTLRVRWVDFADGIGVAAHAWFTVNGVYSGQTGTKVMTNTVPFCSKNGVFCVRDESSSPDDKGNYMGLMYGNMWRTYRNPSLHRNVGNGGDDDEFEYWDCI